MDHALEQRPVLVPRVPAAGHPVELEVRLHASEEILVDDPLVLALVDMLVVAHLPDVDDIGQQLEERRAVGSLPAHRPAGLGRPRLGRPAELVEAPRQRPHGAQLEVQLEDVPHALGLLRVDDELRAALARDGVVAQHRVAARPLPLAPHRAAGRRNDPQAHEHTSGCKFFTCKTCLTDDGYRPRRP